MATKAQVQAAHDSLVANSAKFDSWLNGAADETVMLGESEVPTLLGIIAGFEIPAFADQSAAITNFAAIGKVFLNMQTGDFEVTPAASV